MSNWSKSVIYGGIYPKTQSQIISPEGDQKIILKYQRLISRLKKSREIVQKNWQISKRLYLQIKDNLKSYLSRKQEFYWPVLIAITLLFFVFASKIAFAEIVDSPNNLPIKNDSKLNLASIVNDSKSEKACAINGKNVIPQKKEAETNPNTENEDLKNEIASIIKNTPMAAMVDPISEKNRTVAAFIVGIAMKESKFGVYAPHVGGRDCFNYWGLKAGGKTTSGGYTCFSSPEEAVSVVGKTVEKMVAKGVRTPAQAISWKCGSSCAGHGAENVRKWIADVGVNFYKLNS